MKIAKGKWRIVFVFPWFGIVIKIPVIRFYEGIKPFLKPKEWKRLKGRTVLLKLMIKYRRPFLFGGLVNNWNEFWFYLKTRNPFLQPTYFSFFGLFNIQRYGEPCNLPIIDLWKCLYKITNGEVFEDSHTFGDPNNFCFYNGKLRIVDYGSRRTHPVIRRYGKRIIELFNSVFLERRKEIRTL